MSSTLSITKNTSKNESLYFLRDKSLFLGVLIRSGEGRSRLFQTGHGLKLGALEEEVFVWQEIVLEIVISESAVLFSLVDPVSVLHDHMSVEFVQPEFCGFYFRVNGSEQEQAGTCDAGYSKVLVEGSLTDSFNSKPADGQQVPNPGNYSQSGTAIEEEHEAGSGEGVGLHISLKEIIPVSCKHQSNHQKEKYLWPLSMK